MIEEGKYGFGIISAHRYELPVDENKKRHEDLKGEIKSKGFGFVELRGRFEGKDELQIQKKLTNK